MPGSRPRTALALALLVTGAVAVGGATTHAPARPAHAAAPAVATRRAATAKQLPPGPGRELVERGCLACHSAMLITQQRKDSTGWEKTVQQMEKWGGGARPEERATLMDYLRRHFAAGAK